MFPMATNLVEASYTNPIQDRIRSLKLPQFSAWEGFDAVEDAFDKNIKAHSTTGKRTIYLSLDYEKMDTTVRKQHSLLIYKLVRNLFQKTY